MGKRVLTAVLMLLLIFGCQPALAGEPERNSDSEKLDQFLTEMDGTSFRVPEKEWDWNCDSEGRFPAAVFGSDPLPALLKDGTLGFVRGQKYFVGTGAASVDQRIYRPDGKGNIKVVRQGTSVLNLGNRSVKITAVSPKQSVKRLRMHVGGIRKVCLKDSLGRDLSELGFPLSWNVEGNRNVVQVVSGNIIGLSPGKARVVARTGGKRFVFPVSVVKSDPPGVHRSLPLKSRIRLNRFGDTVSWKSDSGSVIIEGGTAYVQGTGEAELTASDGRVCTVFGEDVTDVYSGLQGHRGFRKTGKNLYSLTLSPGESFLLLDEKIREIPCWKSRSPLVASVTDIGLIRAFSEGQTILTASIGRKKFRVKVTVVNTGSQREEEKLNTGTLYYLTPRSGQDGLIAEVDEKGNMKWKRCEARQVHTVIFDTGEGSRVASQRVPDGSMAAEPAEPVMDGGSFDGWYCGDLRYDFRTRVRQDLILEARWTRLFGIRFETEGENHPEDVRVREGEPVREPEPPVREGFCFSGWYKNGKPYDFSAPVLGNLLLEGRFEPIRYRITFHPGGGAGETEEGEAWAGGVEYRLPEPGFTRQGYRFGGWNSKADGTGRAFLPGEVLEIPKGIPKECSGDRIDLFALWIPCRYYIEYDGNGADSGEMEPDECVFGQEISLKENGYRKTGYVFSGWEYGGSLYSERQALRDLTDREGERLHFTAVWVKDRAVPFQVRHFLMDPDGTYPEFPAVTDFLLGEAFSEVSPAVRSFPGFEAPPVQKVTVAGDGSTVHSYCYERKTYSLTLKPGNGEADRVLRIRYGAVLPEEALSGPEDRAGYEFRGWYDAEEPGEVREVMPDRDLVLLPRFAPVRYEISYDLSGGTLPGKKRYFTVESGTFSLGSPSRPGYEFAGWTGSILPGLTKEASVPAGTVGDLFFKAHWTEKVNLNNAYAVCLAALDPAAGTGTFYPAAGECLMNSYRMHDPGSGKRCIHQDDWETIISMLRLDPGVYSECVSHRCTKGIELSDFPASGGGYDFPADFVTEKGDGTSILCHGKWNDGADISGGYGDASMRRFLEETVLPLFPEALRKAMVPSGPASDRLWLLSSEDAEKILQNGGSLKGYTSSGLTDYWWLCGPASPEEGMESYVNSDGEIRKIGYTYTNGIAPAFVLK